MTSNVERKGGARNFIAASLIGLTASSTSIAHLQRNQPLERPSNPTANRVDKSSVKQRIPRPHGYSGPRISPSTNIKSGTTENMRTVRPRRAMVPQPSNVRDLSSSANVRPEKTPYGQQVGKPFVETRTKKNEREETKGVFKLLSLLEKVSPGEAQMFRDTLAKVMNGGIPNLSIESIQQQALEALNASVVRIVQRASPADLDNLAALDFDKINNPAIGSLLKNTSIAEDQQIASMLLADEISKLIESYQDKFDKSFKQDLSNTVNSFIKDYGQNILLGLNASMLAGLVGTVLTNVSLADIKKRGRSLTAGILLLASACGTAISPLISPISSAAPLTTPEPTPTQAILPTGTPSIESQATLIAPSNPSMESPYAGLNFGDVAGKPFGSIAALNVNASNPNFILPDNQTESKHNFYYRSGAPDALRGFGLDQEYLADVFNASADKGGLTGQLPDGTEVSFVNGFWQYDKSGQIYYLLSNVANLSGRLLGYPLLVVDKVTGKQLFFGIVDDNGVLVEGSKFGPAFLSTADLAKNLGYTGDQSLIGSFQYDQYGNIVILDTQGNRLSVLPYLNPFAPSPTPEPTLAPTEIAPTVAPTLISKPTEAAPTMEVNLDTVEVIPRSGAATYGLEAKYRNIDLSYKHFAELNKEAGFDTAQYPYSYKGPSAEHELPYITAVFIDAYRKVYPGIDNPIPMYKIGVFGPKGFIIVESDLVSFYNKLKSYPDILSQPVAGVRWNSTDPISVQSPQLVRNTTQFVDVNAIIDHAPDLRGYLMMISVAKFPNDEEHANENFLRYFAGEPDIIAPPPFTSSGSNGSQAGGLAFAVPNDIFKALLYKP